MGKTGFLEGPGLIATLQTGDMREQRGFTLLETLIAIALLSIVMSAAFQALLQYDRLFFRLEGRQLAGVLLQSKIAALENGSQRTVSGEDESMGRRFRWQAVVLSSDPYMGRDGSLQTVARRLSLDSSEATPPFSLDYDITWIGLLR